MANVNETLQLLEEILLENNRKGYPLYQKRCIFNRKIWQCCNRDLRMIKVGVLKLKNQNRISKSDQLEVDEFLDKVMKREKSAEFPIHIELDLAELLSLRILQLFKIGRFFIKRKQSVFRMINENVKNVKRNGKSKGAFKVLYELKKIFRLRKREMFYFLKTCNRRKLRNFSYGIRGIIERIIMNTDSTLNEYLSFWKWKIIDKRLREKKELLSYTEKLTRAIIGKVVFKGFSSYWTRMRKTMRLKRLVTFSIMRWLIVHNSYFFRWKRLTKNPIKTKVNIYNFSKDFNGKIIFSVLNLFRSHFHRRLKAIFELFYYNGLTKQKIIKVRILKRTIRKIVICRHLRSRSLNMVNFLTEDQIRKLGNVFKISNLRYIFVKVLAFKKIIKVFADYKRNEGQDIPGIKKDKMKAIVKHIGKVMKNIRLVALKKWLNLSVVKNNKKLHDFLLVLFRIESLKKANLRFSLLTIHKYSKNDSACLLNDLRLNAMRYEYSKQEIISKWYFKYRKLIEINKIFTRVIESCSNTYKNMSLSRWKSNISALSQSKEAPKKKLDSLAEAIFNKLESSNLLQKISEKPLKKFFLALKLKAKSYSLLLKYVLKIILTSSATEPSAFWKWKLLSRDKRKGLNPKYESLLNRLKLLINRKRRNFKFLAFHFISVSYLDGSSFYIQNTSKNSNNGSRLTNDISECSDVNFPLRAISVIFNILITSTNRRKISAFAALSYILLKKEKKSEGKSKISQLKKQKNKILNENLEIKLKNKMASRQLKLKKNNIFRSFEKLKLLCVKNIVKILSNRLALKVLSSFILIRNN